MTMSETLRRFGSILSMVIAIGTIGVAEAQDHSQQVIILDECEPTSFNTQFGPGTCLNVVSLGGVPLADFLGALPTGHPAWLFYPTDPVTIKKKDSLRVVNQGGEIHTFTEVAEFGGGFLPVLNNPPNSPAIQECAGGYANNTELASTRVLQGSSLEISGLKKGLHRFQCCVHPWMRMEIEVK